MTSEVTFIEAAQLAAYELDTSPADIDTAVAAADIEHGARPLLCTAATLRISISITFSRAQG